MKVVNAAGESEMNQDQWEAASAFSFLPFLLLSYAWQLILAFRRSLPRLCARAPLRTGLASPSVGPARQPGRRAGLAPAVAVGFGRWDQGRHAGRPTHALSFP